MPRPKPDRSKETEIETAAESTRQARISLPLTDEGTIDWSGVREKTRDKFIDAVTRDNAALQMVGLKSAALEEKPNPLLITESHVADFLDGYAQIECIVLPRLIEKRTQGRVKLSPEIASAAYTFTDEQKAKMAPAGAEWANEALSDSIKKFLLDVGAGAKFAGLLGFYTMQQTKTAMNMWSRAQERIVAPNGSNGHAVPVATGGVEN